MGFNKIEEILQIASEKNISFWEVIIKDDMHERNVSFENSFEKS